jgi:Tol biopolymer transport system component
MPTISLSPDGRRAAGHPRQRRHVDGLQDLWIMDLDGNNLGQVTHEPSRYGTYSWAPVPR